MIDDAYATLSPSPDDRALQQGFEANLHDPVWFLARQWQMGEHQGENASTPVRVEYRLVQTPIPSSQAVPLRDPRTVPGEVIVEAEPDDFWTMGRRIRVGRRLAGLVPDDETRAVYLFRSPSAPYERFHGAVDGLQLWRHRNRLPLGTDFGPEAPGQSGESGWNSRELHYDREFPSSDAGLQVREHHGGSLDWYSADASSQLQTEATVESRVVVPTPLEYPGAPASRYWQIEDASVDMGGYAPDRAHFSTMLLVDLIYSHGDDWFLMPVTARAGGLVELREIRVYDAFNLEYSSQNPHYEKGLSPPKDWSLFRTTGLEPGQLLLWNVVETPIESIPLERVQFGVDEASNLVWAVERVVDGRDTHSVPPLQADMAGQSSVMIRGEGDMTKKRLWRYLPSDPPQRFWHPYLREADRRDLTLHGLADLSKTPARPMDYPQAEVLRDRGQGEEKLHALSSGSIPSNGISVERRWLLARDIEGNPLLWIERQRHPLLSPPGRTLRYDISHDV